MSPDQINQFFSFLYEGRVGEVTAWLRLIAGVLTSAFLAGIIVIIIKFRELISGHAPAAATAGRRTLPEISIAGPWQEVRQHLSSTNPADWNLAVIRADAALDSVLKDIGLGGETMGERLKQLDRARLSSLDGVWEAHKTRNRIAHEAEAVLTHEEARRAVELFETALRELQYLEE